jgi:hypothetical protein
MSFFVPLMFLSSPHCIAGWAARDIMLATRERCSEWQGSVQMGLKS